MRDYHSLVLANKIRRILKFSIENDHLSFNQETLSELIAEGKFDEFVYYTKTPSGKISKKYSKSKTIKKYIDLMKSLEILDKNCRSMLNINIIENDESYFDNLSEKSKSIMSKPPMELDVQKISETAKKILKSKESSLPELKKIHQELKVKISQWKFTQYLRLYSLVETSLLRFQMKYLVLPKDYAEDK
jgi:hypothetical protein